MARIVVLSESVASRIAAGEVVDRPASALKELVENALDAGARTIDVSLGAGGRDAIVVSDDGEGMDPDDLLLALERHATSKIQSDADIERIRTLGFRGEAVPSIASVSRFKIASRDAGSEFATSVEVHGGRIVSVEREAAPRGTRVEVLSLFYNAPARRKFLRLAETERQRSVDMLSRFAIGYPEVRFRLVAEGKLMFDHAPVGDPFERCAQVFGRGLTAKLHPVAGSDGVHEVAGLCSGLDETRSHVRDQHLYVNRRPVRDKLLSHAIAQAYYAALPRGRHPVVILLLTVPAESVDVNVHPSKSEVRFRKPTEIHTFLEETLRDALRKGGVEPELGLGAPAWRGSQTARGAGSFPRWAVPGAEPDRSVRAAEPGPGAGMDPYEQQATGARPPRAPLWNAEPPGVWRFVEEGAGSNVPPKEADRSERVPPLPLAQFLDSYIVAADGDELLLVDQHAAHERILYERLLGGAPEGERAERPPAQRLLTPAVVETAQSDGPWVDLAVAALVAVGFEVEAFGKGTLLVRAVPVSLVDAEPGALVREILSDLREELAPAAPEERRRRVAASAACHAAIKVRHPLSEAKQTWLMQELVRCKTPTTCPHGRPAIVRLTREQIERGFHRR